AAPDRPHDPGKHARFEKVVQDMPARIGDSADLVDHRLRQFGKTVHVGQRIALPAHAADLLVVVRVAVGQDVEAGYFLRPQKARDRILVLLAVARIDHGFEEALRSQHCGVPGRPRQRADDGGWQSDTRGRLVHRSLSCCAVPLAFPAAEEGRAVQKWYASLLGAAFFTNASSGFGSGAPESRKRLTMG